MVAKALAVQQPPIPCVSLLAGGATSARSDAVQRFRDDESVRVFLLSLNAGAQGLTLVRGKAGDAAQLHQSIAQLIHAPIDMPCGPHSFSPVHCALPISQHLPPAVHCCKYAN